MSRRLLTSSATSILSALPSSPVDGQEIRYQNAAMATAGVVWSFRYSAAGGTYPWHSVGGSTLAGYGSATDYSTRLPNPANSASYGFWDASSAEVVVPLAGEYEVQASTIGVGTNTSCAPGFWLGYNGQSIPGWSAADAMGSMFAAGGVAPMAANKRLLVPAFAGIRMYYFNANIGGGVQFYQSRLLVRPVRVTG